MGDKNKEKPKPEKCRVCGNALNPANRKSQIQCAKCKCHYHLVCVGKTAEDKVQPFTCKRCIMAAPAGQLIIDCSQQPQASTSSTGGAATGGGTETVPQIQINEPQQNQEVETGIESEVNFDLDEALSLEEQNTKMKDFLAQAIAKIEQFKKAVTESSLREQSATANAEVEKAKLEKEREAHFREREAHQIDIDNFEREREGFHNMQENFEKELTDAKAAELNAREENEEIIKQLTEELNRVSDRCEAARAELQESVETIESQMQELEELRKQQVARTNSPDIATQPSGLNPQAEPFRTPSTLDKAKEALVHVRNRESRATTVEMDPLPETQINKQRRVIEIDDDQKSTTSNATNESSSSRPQLSCLELQLLRKELETLPIFDGSNPSSWLDFESLYEETTLDGEYDQIKNVRRLRLAIQGDARAVVGDLITGRDADIIMDTLRDYYGNTETQVKELAEKVANLPNLQGPTDKKFTTFISTVAGYARRMRSMKMIHDLNSFTYASQIHDKMVHYHRLHRLVTTAMEKYKNLQVDSTTSLLEEMVAVMRTEWKTTSALSQKLASEKSSSNYASGKSGSNYVSGKLNSTKKNTHRVMAHIPVSNNKTNNQSTTANVEVCSICGSNGHKIYKCANFKAMSIPDRVQAAKNKRLCFSCLRSDHMSAKCNIRRVCNINNCQSYHNRFLHNKEAETPPQQPAQVPNPNPNPPVQNANANPPQVQQPAAPAQQAPHFTIIHDFGYHQNGGVLAKIVYVRIYGRNGKYVDTFAYLDDGSHITMMEKEIAAYLELPGETCVLNLQWTGEQTRKEYAMKCSLEISGKNLGRRYKFHDVYAVDNLSLPEQTQDANELRELYPYLKNLKIPSFVKGKPKILIGLDKSDFLISDKPVHGESSEQPSAAKCKFGWVVYGRTATSNSQALLSAIHIPILHTYVKPIIGENEYDGSKSDEELHELVRRSMTLENMGVSATTRDVQSLADQRAEDIMTKTLNFKDGRYEIGLLWKDDDPVLPDSLPMARKRMRSLTKSLHNKPETRNWLIEHVQELVKKGYARVATDEDLNTNWKRKWYLPMFVVYNMNKLPPKPRCVWDAAAKHSYPDGVSLNSFLLAGPDYITSLVQGLTKFREQAVAVNGDVKEMFHQVKATLEDQQCFRFIFDNCDLNQKEVHYLMSSLPFGPADSPAKVNFVKNHHALKYKDECPEASEALRKFTYVDDYFNSHATVEEALRVTQDAIKITKDMSWDLIGFQSNNRELLEKLPKENVKEKLVNLDTSESPEYTTKVLGMHWDPIKDEFFYVRKNNDLMKSMMTDDFIPTKRETLRVVSSMFDPLGLIAKYLIRGKMIIQDIWIDGTNWDEKISEELAEAWRKFIGTFDLIEDLRINRQYAPVDPRRCRVELVNFVDASDRAFACVSYFRFITEDNTVYVALAGAKAKVAPVNPMSIPRLELQGGLLGARHSQNIIDTHTFEIASKKFLTDSTCVLSWICNPKSKQDKFIGSRISEILDKTSSSEWYHVGTKFNVADEATKITTEEDEITSSRWFTGPDFLKLEPESWPITKEIGKFVNTHLVTPKVYDPIDEASPKFRANWKLIVNMVAYMMRFQDQLDKTKQRNPSSFITAEEFQRAELIVFRKIQKDAFADEIKDLMEWSKRPAHQQQIINRVSRSSNIHSLLPFLDKRDIIRMDSRNQSKKFAYATRNPVILPNRHELVDAFIRYHHERIHHFGTEEVIANIRERAWIIAIRIAVLRVKSKCVRCKLLNTQPQLPITGQLHEATTAYELEAFSHVGCDCFGPLYVKRGRGTEKRWVVLFTCLTYRAIHMEIVRDMSADKMLGAIRRLSRRGKPIRLYSDNGTNFTGANSTTLRDHQEVLETLGKSVADNMRIDWHFLPAYSPWSGGAWEKLIHLVKRVMRDTLTDEALEEDVLANVLIEAEIIINNRPLTHTPTNPEDEEPLTPNMRIYGQRQPARYIVASQENDIYSKDSHYQAQAWGDRIAARFVKEYLPEISRRSEKSLGRKSIQLDDVVLVTEPNKPRSEWKLGRVTKIHPTKDGIARMIDVKYANGKLEERRAVGRCALLDIRGEDTSMSASE